MIKILKYVVYDVLRSRMVVAYALLLFLLSTALFYLGADASKTIVSIMHIMLLIVPLISIIFGTIHYYNSREFIELLLAQPIKRATIFYGQYLGVSFSLVLALLIGLGIPVALNGFPVSALWLLFTGIALTFIFTGLAFLASVRSSDKARGIGLALLLWFYFSVLFDGLVIIILFYFNDYPLEKAVIAMTSLNPIDLGRVIILLKLDTSALMGYTGALYQKFFGTNFGITFSITLLLVWTILPLFIAGKSFSKKDL